MNRKIGTVYMITLRRGIETEVLKVVSSKKLAKYYVDKYESKYPHNAIEYDTVDFVQE